MIILQFLTRASLVALCMAYRSSSSEKSVAADGGGQVKGEVFDASEFPFCGGLHQSPVDINTDKAVDNPSLGNFVFNNFDIPTSQDLELKNAGEAAKLLGFDGSLTMSEGGLPAENYILEQLHFHVGSRDEMGSEHSIDGNFYPAEMHLVFYSSDYADFSSAVNRPQGLAVLGVLFEVSDQDNEALEPIVKQLCNIEQPDQKAAVDPMTIRALLPSDVSEFYRYLGSLTTPPCFESVVWTVFKETTPISEKQLDNFRGCLIGVHGERIVDNFRRIQPLNGRLIAVTD